MGAVAAYGAVLADALVRAGSLAWAMAPSAGAGSLVLLVALARGSGPLGAALMLGGVTYVVAIVIAGGHIDATAPLVAVLLLLCGELSAWSLDERWRIRSDEALDWRRGLAVGALALLGLAAATLAVALGAVPSGHGLVWTAAGAAAAVGAAGTGVWLAWR